MAIKSDDDTIVFPGGLQEVLDKRPQNKSEIYGYIFQGFGPVRDPGSIW